MAYDISALTPREQVTAIYVAYYDRAPDPGGLNFWTAQLEEFLDGDGDGNPGMSLQAIATAFANSQESKDLYGYFDPDVGGSSGAFLTSVYINLFGRLPDADGLLFWQGKLDSGQLPVGEALLAIMGGAQGSDIAILENKVEVALDWHDDALANGRLLLTPEDEVAARTILDNVDETDASVTDAKATTDAYFNDDPVAADDAASTDEDVPVTIDVLANDTDADGDTLTVTAVGAAANGTVVDNGDGTVTYTPDADFNGSDSFTYTVEDGHGGSDTATVTVDVAAVNDDPVAADDAASADRNAAVTIDVLANDTDVDGDVLSVTAVGAAANGTVVDNGDGTVTYTPDLDFTGTDSFTYTVGDGQGGFDTATVTVDVTTPSGQTFILTDGVDASPAFDGGEGDDTYLANQNTLNNSDSLDGGGVGNSDNDILKVSVQKGTGSFFAAPTLVNIETIEVNGPNIDFWQNITFDLSNASGYETLRSFQTTVNGPNNTWVAFRDIQDAVNTDIEIIDTDVNHSFRYDSNAFVTLFGGNDDAVDMTVQEVDGSTINLGLENPVPGTPGGNLRSHVDIVNLTSLARHQVNPTTFNYIYDLNVGPFFNELNVTGDADLEIELFLDENVNDVDASTLDGDFTIDLLGQGTIFPFQDLNGPPQTDFNVAGPHLQVLGAIGDNDIDVKGNTNGTFIFQGGDDALRVGSATEFAYVREDVFGNVIVDTQGGDDEVILNITGQQNVALGDGNDSLIINGNVDDLSTINYNDGVSMIDAGAGDDFVGLFGRPDGYTQDPHDLDNDYDILLGDGDDTLVANQGGDHTVSGGEGNDVISIFGHGNNVIDSGSGDDIVSVFGNGDQSVFTGDGHDDLLITGDGDHTISMGEGDDFGTIFGVGVHNIDLGAGDDDFFIGGGRLPEPNVDNTIEDRQTTINAGDGDDYVGVDGDHYLLMDMGAGNDTVELNADELTTDDFINGNEGIDTLILLNSQGSAIDGRVGASETSSVSSFEIFDLLDSNISLRLTSDNFDSTDAGHITVVTTNAAAVDLPRVPTGGPVWDDLLSNGMSRADYDAASAAYSPIQGGYPTLEDFLLANGVNSIHFVDENADGDADIISVPGGTPALGDGTDSVAFQVEVDGNHTIDITNIPLSVASGRSFELQGGNIRDIVIADDASISSRLILDYDFSTDTNHSAEDTLRVIDGAQITAADLRNVNGLEIIELMSTSNDAQTWDIQLNDRVINQTTGNAPLIIRVDPDVPAGSRVDITLDPSIWTATATNNVVIETVANAQIYINGVLVTEPDFGVTDYNPGPMGTITVVQRLVFTQNTDSLFGSDDNDIFWVDSLSKLQDADSADGRDGHDILYLDNVTVSDPDQSFHSQINTPELRNFEEVHFDTGMNVEMEGLGSALTSPSPAGDSDLNTVRTGSGDDFLDEMEAIGNNSDEGYFLNGGDDFLRTDDNTGEYFVDGGAGDDTVEVQDDDTLALGTDIELVKLEGGADATVRTQHGTNGNTMTITGRPFLDNNNDVTLNSSIMAAVGGLATVMLLDIENVVDVGDNDNNIVLDNERTGHPDSNANVWLNGGDDSLTVTNVDDLVVHAGAGTKTVSVGETGDPALNQGYSSVNTFAYAGGTGPDGGVDNITAVVDDYARISTGDGDDTIDVTTTDNAVNGNAQINGGDGDDNITVDAAHDATVWGGDGNDEIKVDAARDARVFGGDGNDVITVDAGRYATVEGGDGNDEITMTTIDAQASRIITGLGIDSVALNVAANGGKDTIQFGDIVYDALQKVDPATTQNFTQKGVDDPGYTGSANDGIDTITGFNMEGPGGAGADDVLDVSAFINNFSVDTVDAADFAYGDWTGGAFTTVNSGGDTKEIAVIAVDDGFELDASHISATGSGLPGIRVGDNLGRVVVAARDTDGDGGFDTADIYFVQDVDSGPGQAWAVDHVATVEFATEIGAVTSINEDNFIF